TTVIATTSSTVVTAAPGALPPAISSRPLEHAFGVTLVGLRSSNPSTNDDLWGDLGGRTRGRVNTLATVTAPPPVINVQPETTSPPPTGWVITPRPPVTQEVQRPALPALL